MLDLNEIDSNKHHDIMQSVFRDKKDEKELNIESLPKITDSSVMRVELSRIANNSKLITNISFLSCSWCYYSTYIFTSNGIFDII